MEPQITHSLPGDRFEVVTIDCGTRAWSSRSDFSVLSNLYG
ncbi:hypothetical protein [uncultured Shewanella sp.]|nr:hypothetical protein [uncultured Shewanella sp.]